MNRQTVRKYKLFDVELESGKEIRVFIHESLHEESHKLPERIANVLLYKYRP